MNRLFDHNKSNEHWLVFLQGDKRHGGNSSDGVIAPRQIAEVLVHSLTSEAALRKTFGLVAVTGPVQENLEPVFAALDADPEGSSDVVHAAANMPLDEEPQRVTNDAVRAGVVAAYLTERWQMARAVVQGHFNYYAVPGNLDSLGMFRERVLSMWWHVLCRRSQKRGVTWERMIAIAKRWLPSPRVLHPYPAQRFAADHPR